MMLRCAAIDDEPLAIQLLENYAQRMPSIQLVQTFDDAISGIEYLNRHPVDLLFLDINMPDISGIDLARALRQKPMIIFTTAYRQYAYEGFQLEAIDYLLKPIEFETFVKAVQKAISFRQHQLQKNSSPQECYIYVHAEYRLIKIVLAEIEYVESRKDYLHIHIGTNKPVLTLMTLKKLLEMLPEAQFVRIHRSYIINTRKIKALHSKKVQLETVMLPIGDSYGIHLLR